MQDYAAKHASPLLLEEAARSAFMDQSALEATPHFFKIQFLFPYTAGLDFVQEAIRELPDGRDAIFRNPPLTTEQIMYPKKYFGKSPDLPSSLTLLMPEGADWGLPHEAAIPKMPAGFERVAGNAFGEIGIRSLFEDRLGAGIAADAAQGWDGDFCLMSRDADGAWKFVWESSWDGKNDAREFLAAWVTHWRAVYADRKLGSLTAVKQEWRVDGWTVRSERIDNRVALVWHNRTADE
jgi:hypothetical protein